MTVKYKRIKGEHTYRWIPPTELPDLSTANVISVDVETRDERLSEGLGPGGFCNQGMLLGVAIATDERYSGYFSLNHAGEDNWDMDSFSRWFNEQFANKRQKKVGANILYDLEWLRAYGMGVEGTIIDVQGVEALLDEEAINYKLVTLMEKYLDDERLYKLTGLLEDGVRSYLEENVSNVYEHLHRVPADVVGVYAEIDAIGTLKVWQAQEPLIQEQGLEGVLDLECRLIPLLLDMRFQGVKIDVDKLHKTRTKITRSYNTAQKKLNKLAKYEVDIHSADSIAPMFDKLGIEYPLSPKAKKPSFQKQWLAHQDHEVCRVLLDARKYSTINSMFIESIDKYRVGDRLHASFNSLRKDREGSRGTYGTVSGRFSSSEPNLQQQPSRDEETAPMIRGLFLPDDGRDFYSYDYSQVEFRILVHYAVALKFPKADEIQRAYKENPEIDFHTWASELLSLPRRVAKDFNFGLIYGMGIRKLAEGLNVPLGEAQDLYKQYNTGLPFAKGLRDYTGKIASKRGYVKTISGRVRRFNKWEERGWREGKPLPVSHEEALKQYGPRIQRAYTYKALNSVIQGSAADIMKMAMVKAYEGGIFDEDALGTPALTVHDELDGNVPKGKKGKEALKELHHCMENAYPMNVPILVDGGVGSTWWEAK